MTVEHFFGAIGGDAQILHGSIGWDDENDYVFDGDEDNDGHTLVRVQLFEGRDVTKPLNPKRAQGHRILAHISSLNGRRVPAKDTRVFVAVPKGQENVPGAGVIFAAIEKMPRRGGNLKPDETVQLGPDGSQGRVVFKKDGTVGIVTNIGNDPNGKSVVFTISPTGVAFSSPYGSFKLDITGFHMKTAGGPRVDMGSMQIPGLALPDSITGALTGYCNISAPVIKLAGGIVKLGKGSTYNTALGAPASAMATPVPVSTGPASQSPSVLVATGD